MSIAYGGQKVTFADGSSISSGYTGFKNRIINGAMVIDQRNAGASVTPASSYTLDRWAFYNSQASKVTAQQNAGSVTPPPGFTNYLGITSSSAYSVVSTDYFFLQQGIEGYNIADLAWGTSNAKTITLSFWVRSSLTGSFGGGLENANADRTYVFSYTINSANTWEYKTITIPGDTSGTWATDNTNGIKPRFSVGVGSNYQGTVNTWSSTRYFAPTGSVSVVGTSGATWYITGVQLEAGNSATSFDYRDYGNEFRLCQRYYQRQHGNNIQLPMGLMNQGSLSVLGVILPVPMRATPSLDQIAGSVWRFNGYTSGENLTNTWTINGATNQVLSMSASAVPTSGNGYGVQCRAYDTSNYLGYSAEL